ncbi:hypothetical protein P280DRAFT_465693 [Massarina eburnea CBS 473.64]|uniref:F-box domain-containing protein n=1 Tax=Massarina eburnea CBS 473.64 TaxID=1395130 RepID=A0A6A6SEJ0_9PLEO|nr:hypothetical protein P280DRAFT_465693 [Massarina eburnea CBS 473.64]
MCLVNDQFFLESLPMVLRHVDLIVEESYTAYNLLFFLQATKMFSYISSLRFITSEALPPLSAGTALIKECVNLREVWLSFMGQELFKKDALSVKKFGKKEFVENYAIRELLSLRQIKKVTLFVIRDFQCSVLDDVTVAWEMGPWLKKKFHRRGVDVEVVSFFFLCHASKQRQALSNQSVKMLLKIYYCTVP